ncbi:hypothetical protein AVEN_70234-1 [Araneus ventricosus]|uniref:Uncharacterized protein n=1 Tax=Araneus ventricosus TaxID=182803 RepID=A0A4Y2GCU4_ARAVE|nr:hypothetical protein AVEN_70234-1 [Araneus ventricosus]
MEDPMHSILDFLDTEKESLDYIFTKDLLLYVVIDYYSIAYSDPENVFMEKSNNSPFAPEVKLAVENFLDAKGDDLHNEYDLDFPYEDSISNSSHLEKLICITRYFQNKPFDNASFLECLCKCAEYTRLSYMNGISKALHLSLKVICIMLSGMRESGKITQDFWSDFQKYCGKYIRRINRRIPIQRKRKYCEI